MKLNMIWIVFKEGFSNILKNKIMSGISLMMILITLVLAGLSAAVVVNLRYNSEQMKSLPEIVAYCDPDMSQEEIDSAYESIRGIEGVTGVTVVTKAEAYQRAVEMLGNDDRLLQGFGEEIFPVSFVLSLEDASEISRKAREIPGIYKADYSQEMVSVISKISGWMKVVTVALSLLLSFIAITIISNTVKLTVMARKNEIAIMKYVGATEDFIRWPFILEGMILGVIGAILSIFLVLYLYEQFLIYYYSQGSTFFNMFKFVKISDISMVLSVIFTFFGVGIGVFGSMVSMSKYLKL
jgi:cell division transport system permease protein